MQVCNIFAMDLYVFAEENRYWRTYGRRLSLLLNERGKFMQAHLLHVSNHDAAKRRKWLQRCVQKMLVPHMHHSYLHTLVIATAIVVIGQILQNLTLRNCFWKGLGDCPGDSGRFRGDSSPAPWPSGPGRARLLSPPLRKAFQNFQEYRMDHSIFNRFVFIFNMDL